MDKIIYYHFKKDFWSWIWLIFDIVALCALFKCLWCFAPYTYTWQLLTLMILIGAHLGIWLYKYAADNTMAVINDKEIKIDHNNPIAWEDIAYAEEKIVKCCGKERKILSLVPHDGIDYRYNWLQLHNAGFTAFSIPLYGIISPEDEKEIIKLVDKKVGIKTVKPTKAVKSEKAKKAPAAKKAPTTKKASAAKKAPAKKKPVKKTKK